MKHITREYTLLFNTISDTLNALERIQLQLAQTQQQAEMLFMEDPPVAFAGDECPADMVS